MNEDLPMGQDRKYPRYTVNAPATLLSEGQESDGVVLDVSMGGAGVECGRLFENDQFVQLQIEGRNPLAGRIIRKFNNGIAIEFGEENKIDEKALEELEKFRQVRDGGIG